MGDMAALLNAAGARQGALLADLQQAMPRLAACKLALSTNTSSVRHHSPLELGRVSQGVGPALEGDAAMKSISEIYASLAVDMAGVQKLVADTSGALAAVMSKASLAA